jgi:hypothetical protein
MDASRVRLGELLVRAGLISRPQLEETLVAQKQDGRRLGTLLVEAGLVTEAQVTQILSQQLSVPWVSLHHIDFSEQLLRLVPREIVERFCLVPIYVRRVRGLGDALYVAMDDPTNDEALAEVERHAGLHVRAMIAPPEAIRLAIRDNYGVSPLEELPEERTAPKISPDTAGNAGPAHTLASITDQDDDDTKVRWRKDLQGQSESVPDLRRESRRPRPDSIVDLEDTSDVEEIPPDEGYGLASIDDSMLTETTGTLSAYDPDVIEVSGPEYPSSLFTDAAAAFPPNAAEPRRKEEAREEPLLLVRSPSSHPRSAPAPAGHPPTAPPPSSPPSQAPRSAPLPGSRMVPISSPSGSTTARAPTAARASTVPSGGSAQAPSAVAPRPAVRPSAPPVSTASVPASRGDSSSFSRPTALLANASPPASPVASSPASPSAASPVASSPASPSAASPVASSLQGTSPVASPSAASAVASPSPPSADQVPSPRSPGALPHGPRSSPISAGSSMPRSSPGSADAPASSPRASQVQVPAPPSPGSPPPSRRPSSIPPSDWRDPRRAQLRKGLSLTLLDGTTITLPGAGKPGEGAPLQKTEPTVRDLIAALRASARGADASEVLGDRARWESMFAALLSVLVRKGLLTEAEFLEELEKG